MALQRVAAPIARACVTRRSHPATVMLHACALCAALRPTAEQLLKHPFVAGCVDNTPPPSLDETQKANEGTIADLKDIVRKVQEARYFAARKRHERKLRLIAPECVPSERRVALAFPAALLVPPHILLYRRRFARLATQMGLPIAQVARLFNKAQAHYDALLEKAYQARKRRKARARSDGGAAPASADEAAAASSGGGEESGAGGGEGGGAAVAGGGGGATA